MARPRKSLEGNDARQRICLALWRLLETHDLKDITVSMITKEAGCNRGTFYYHFPSVDDLMSSVIADDILRKDDAAELMLRISAGDKGAVVRALEGEPIKRLSLVVNHAGIEMAFGKIFDLLVGMWNSILCAEGEELKPEAQAVVVYYVGGTLSMIAALTNKTLGDITDFDSIVRFIMNNVDFLMDEVCEVQGIPPAVAKDRIATIVQFINSVR